MALELFTLSRWEKVKCELFFFHSPEKWAGRIILAWTSIQLPTVFLCLLWLQGVSVSLLQGCGWVLYIWALVGNMLVQRLVSLVPNSLATCPSSNCIWIWCRKDYGCTCASHKYLSIAMWLFIMCKYVVTSKTRYRLIFDSCCLVTCRRTACSRLALAHQWRYAWLTVSTAEQALHCYSWKVCKKKRFVCKYCSSYKQVSRRSSNKTVVPSTSGTMGRVQYIRYTVKFYNCHIKRSEIWLILRTPEQWKSTVWTRVSCQAGINERPGYEAEVEWAP